MFLWGYDHEYDTCMGYEAYLIWWYVYFENNKILYMKDIFSNVYKFLKQNEYIIAIVLIHKITFLGHCQNKKNIINYCHNKSITTP